MPAGNIQIHIHRTVLAIRVLRWVIQFSLGWTEAKWPRVVVWQGGTYWIEWLWFLLFIRHETNEQYHQAIGQ